MRHCFQRVGDEVSTDKAQHAFAMSYGCAAEQDVGLINAVNRSVCWNLATDDMAKVGRIHDREQAYVVVLGLTLRANG